MAKVNVVRSAATQVTIQRDINAPLVANNVTSQRPVTTVEGLADVTFPTEDAEKQARDGFVMVYDSGTDKFILVDPDVVLSQSVEDGDLPDDFIDQLEDEIDLGNVQLDNVDGGGFV
jgi:hypothetical protein|tara:strand:- start:581 stop:931 length:351 start_codon:yes stop_codon:yes gene_type:complete